MERSPERPILSVRKVLELADTIEPRYRALLLLATFGGLRLGELLALTRRRIDLEAGAVRVEESASELKDGTRLIGPPKTDAGTRSVALPQPVVSELRKHLAQFTGPEPDALVFVGPKGGALRRGSFYTAWERARRQLGLETLHFHDLRHTGISIAAGTGVSTAELMRRMGHASPRAALIYQHASDERDQEIARQLGNLIAQERKPRGSRHTPGTRRSGGLAVVDTSSR